MARRRDGRGHADPSARFVYPARARELPGPGPPALQNAPRSARDRRGGVGGGVRGRGRGSARMRASTAGQLGASRLPGGLSMFGSHVRRLSLAALVLLAASVTGASAAQAARHGLTVDDVLAMQR